MDSYNFAAQASASTHAPSPSPAAPSCRAQNPGGILFYGDPHGCFEPLIAAADLLKPAAVVLLGDCDLHGPLAKVLAPIVEMGCPVHWIAGNHDSNKTDRFEGGLPLRHRSTVFPEDLLALGTLRYDVLVAHEAPSSHPHGWAVLDDLAAAAGARLIVHGHHHQSYSSHLANGIAVRGLGLAEPWYLEAADVAQI